MVVLFITKLRELRGWSKAELARRANMAAPCVGQLEHGRLQPYPVQAAKLAAALGWTGDPSALFEEVIER
jgi:ribosome-binding protein aMBF1 (putative translation factor)